MELKTNKKISVLIVDDSALMREALMVVLSENSDIEIVGVARDGQEGVEKARTLKPDVITMDLQMPIMGGMEAIEKIMREMPTPIIVVSSMDNDAVLKALSFGAMDFVAITQEIEEIAKELIMKVRVASNVKPLGILKMSDISVSRIGKGTAAAKVVAIGVSTGGPQALGILLSMIPRGTSASFLVVQHISAGFINGLVLWLREVTELDVKVAESGEIVEEGVVYLAPDQCHMGVNNMKRIVLKDDIAVKTQHVLSINELMFSVSDIYGCEAVGILMTGMGDDGVKGMKAIKDGGGFTIAQDEETSMIFGMNRVAIEEGHVDAVVSLDNIAEKIIGKL